MITEIYTCMSLCVKKTKIWVPTRSDTKSGCTVTEDSEMLEILDLGSRGIVLSD